MMFIILTDLVIISWDLKIISLRLSSDIDNARINILILYNCFIVSYSINAHCAIYLIDKKNVSLAIYILIHINEYLYFLYDISINDVSFSQLLGVLVDL